VQKHWISCYFDFYSCGPEEVLVKGGIVDKVAPSSLFQKSLYLFESLLRYLPPNFGS